MYPQRDQRTDRSQDKTQRASRDYARSANFVLDLAEWISSHPHVPRPEKWHNGRVKFKVWADTNGFLGINLIKRDGSSEQVVAGPTWTVTTPGKAQEFNFSPQYDFEIDADTMLIQVNATASLGIRLEYVPRHRQ